MLVDVNLQSTNLCCVCNAGTYLEEIAICVLDGGRDGAHPSCIGLPTLLGIFFYKVVF